ncbi:hypothetical protein, partial [Profundibacter sp.]
NASSATVALNLSEKFRRFVILVSIRSCWIHLSTLPEFAGPLHIAEIQSRGGMAYNPAAVIISAAELKRK